MVCIYLFFFSLFNFRFSFGLSCAFFFCSLLPLSLLPLSPISVPPRLEMTVPPCASGCSRRVLSGPLLSKSRQPRVVSEHPHWDREQTPQTIFNGIVTLRGLPASIQLYPTQTKREADLNCFQGGLKIEHLRQLRHAKGRIGDDPWSGRL